jgi:hypothetical protein
MENRTALRGTGSSRWLVAVLVVVVTLALGMIAAYVAKGVSTPAATHTNIVSTQAAATNEGRDEPAYSIDPSGYSLIP